MAMPRRLLVACHLPVGWGQGSRARPFRALRSNGQEFGVRLCVGSGCIFHKLLALGGGPDRGWPVTCRGVAGRAVGSHLLAGHWQAQHTPCQGSTGASGSVGEPTQMFYLLLPPQTTEPPSLALACHRSLSPPRAGEEERKTCTKIYTEFIFRRISTCPRVREVAGLTPWVLRIPSNPPAGPS